MEIETVLVGDLTGAPVAGTVRFGVDGRHYELDLSQDTAKQLRAEMRNYVFRAPGRGAGGRTGSHAHPDLSQEQRVRGRRPRAYSS
ncbi:histone-like nucleoid-structuring protein Lsr2 [Micrococcus sp. TA1]|uniref:Lsr2 dimerization domain-containing protein n=2 Tax=Micrococcaceae TaxID=1268 RepID=UPI00161A2CD1